jgi:hypothetical protein
VFSVRYFRLQGVNVSAEKDNDIVGAALFVSNLFQFCSFHSV